MIFQKYSIAVLFRMAIRISCSGLNFLRESEESLTLFRAMFSFMYNSSRAYVPTMSNTLNAGHPLRSKTSIFRHKARYMYSNLGLPERSKDWMEWHSSDRFRSFGFPFRFSSLMPENCGKASCSKEAHWLTSIAASRTAVYHHISVPHHA